MEKINLAFLGTGNAIPTIKRNHTSILFSYKNENILIDCGEGTQRQFRHLQISPSKLTRILITHWHGDHILGLPGLFQTLAMNNYQKTLQIYGPKGTKNKIEAIKNLVNVQIKLQVHEVLGQFLNLPDFCIESSPMSHGTPTNAYSIIIKEKRRLDKSKLKKLKIPNSPLLKNLQEGKSIVLNGKKISSSQVSYLEKQKKITFILDTALNPNALKIAKSSDLLITEASFSSEEESQAKEYKHLTAKQAATIAKKSKSKTLILTHLSQRYENAPQVLEKEAKSIFKNTKLVKDFDQITL